jgi:hypothetical protein
MKAFPTEHPLPGYMDLMSDGMDLRDYFAAKALMSMGHFYVNAIDNKTIAKYAYEMADAMMEARND